MTAGVTSRTGRFARYATADELSLAQSWRILAWFECDGTEWRTIDADGLICITCFGSRPSREVPAVAVLTARTQLGARFDLGYCGQHLGGRYMERRVEGGRLIELRPVGGGSE